jgi:prepilin-type N-terminal cleavage/methylation domain-containing protein
MNEVRHRRVGFTLIELLVVISIMGLMISLLIPTVSMAMQAARRNMTAGIIRQIEAGLNTYRDDFGGFPPSRPDRGETDLKVKANIGPMPTGAANLVYYLRGPSGNGWGTGAGGRLPGDTGSSVSAARGSRSFGPYYRVETDALKWGSVPGVSDPVPLGFLDAFKPAGVILYFRYDPHPDMDATGIKPYPAYQLADNNTMSPAMGTTRYDGTDVGDPEALVNFGDQAKLDELVRVSRPSISYYVYKYYREDYVLVSPGADGRYGYTTTDKDGNVKADSKSQATDTYDDVSDF